MRIIAELNRGSAAVVYAAMRKRVLGSPMAEDTYKLMAALVAEERGFRQGNSTLGHHPQLATGVIGVIP